MNRFIWMFVLGAAILSLLVPVFAPETAETFGTIAVAFSFYFLGAEHSSLSDGVPRNTMSEFIWWTVTDKPARFVIGCLLALAVYLRVSGVLGVGLFLWLPLHLAFPGYEKKLFNYLKEKFA